MEDLSKISKTDVDKIKDKIAIQEVHSKQSIPLPCALMTIDLSTDEKKVTKLKLDIEILEKTIESLKDMILQEKNKYELHKREGIKILSDLKASALKDANEINRLKSEILRLVKSVEEQNIQILNLRKSSATESMNYGNLVLEKMELKKQYNIFQEELYRTKGDLLQKNEDIDGLNEEIDKLKIKLNSNEREIVKKNETISKMGKENLVKVISIGSISKELIEERKEKEQFRKELEKKEKELGDLEKKLGAVFRYGEAVNTLMKENEVLVTTGTVPMTPIEKIHEYSLCKLSCTSAPMESHKIIASLQKIIQEKEKTITELQNKIAQYENLIAEDKDEIMDATDELGASVRNLSTLFDRLKKIFDRGSESSKEGSSETSESDYYRSMNCK